MDAALEEHRDERPWAGMTSDDNAAEDDRPVELEDEQRDSGAGEERGEAAPTESSRATPSSVGGAAPC